MTGLLVQDILVDPDDIITACSAGVAVIAAFIAIWQAVSASKQSEHAEEQADAAILQAEEARRSADAAWAQLRQTQKDSSAAELIRMNEAMHQLVEAGRDHIYTFLEAVAAASAGNHAVSGPLWVRLFRQTIHTHPAMSMLLGGLPRDAELLRITAEVGHFSIELYDAGMQVIVAELNDDGSMSDAKNNADDTQRKLHDSLRRLSDAGSAFFAIKFREVAESETEG